MSNRIVRFVALSFAAGCLMSAMIDVTANAQSPLLPPNPAVPWPRLAGKIVDSTGAPVPDVQLFWQALSSVDGKTAEFIEGRSDVDGAFKLKSPTERLGYMGGRPYGHLWVIPPGHALQVCPAGDFLVQDGKTPATLALKPSQPLKCQILGPDVLPRAGELVEAEAIRIDGKEYHVRPRLRELLGGVTDGEGVWQTDRFDERTTMRVRVISQTYGRQVQLWPIDATRDFSVRMQPAGTIEGQINAPELYRYEGRAVRVSSHAQRPPEPPRDRDVAAPLYFTTGEATTLVDRNGRFRIPTIAAGQVFVSLSNPQDTEWETQGSENFILKEGETKKIEFESARKVGLEGKVEFSDGSPAAGVRIEVNVGRKWNLVHATTDSEGRFQCQVRPGEIKTRLILDKYKGTPVIFGAVRVEGVTRVAADSKSTTAETLRFPKVVLVQADVVDKAGKAIPNSTINITREREGFHQSKAGPTGRFEIYRPANVEFKDYVVKVNGEIASVLEHPGEPTLIRVED